MVIQQTQLKYSKNIIVLTDGSTIKSYNIGSRLKTNKFFSEMYSVKHPIWLSGDNFQELEQTGRLTDFVNKFGDFI